MCASMDLNVGVLGMCVVREAVDGPGQRQCSADSPYAYSAGTRVHKYLQWTRSACPRTARTGRERQF